MRYRASIHKSRRFKRLWHIDILDAITSRFYTTHVTSSHGGAVAIACGELRRLNRD